MDSIVSLPPPLAVVTTMMVVEEEQESKLDQNGDKTEQGDKENEPQSCPIAGTTVKLEMRSLSDLNTSSKVKADPVKDTSKVPKASAPLTTPVVEEVTVVEEPATTVTCQDVVVATTTTEPLALPTILVLLSNLSMDRRVAAKQRQALQILDAKNMPYETLDGADQQNKDTRNNLFTVSGMHAQYPQFFLVRGDQLHFWGDWERFQASNDMGTIVEDMLGEDASRASAKSDTPKDKPRLELEASNEMETLVEDASHAHESAKLDTTNDEPIACTPGTCTAESFTATENETASLANEVLEIEPVAGNDQSTGATEKGTDATEKGTTKEISPNLQTGTKGRGLPPSGKKTSFDKKQDKDILTSDTSRSVGVKDSGRSVETDITIYGATSFVAKHVLAYLTQNSRHLGQELKITLAGRNPSKLQSIHSDITEKMKNLRIVYPDATGYCTFDTFVADSADTEALQKMADRTRVVLSCAGPFTKCGSNVVLACALTGADYVDITGEISWAGDMRAQHGSKAAASGSRIISFCGFDSIPSDLAVYTAIEALKERSKAKPVTIERATTWHNVFGFANGGTIQTVLDMPVNFSHCFFQPVPFLLEDPLVLTHPSVRSDPASQATRNRLAASEWWNQLLSFDTIIRLGISVPFFMAVCNAKIVHASAVALKYGPNFTYRERHLPVGFLMTSQLGFISLLPALLTQLGLLLFFLVLKIPVIGRAIVDRLLPAGAGPSDQMCRAGVAEVYAEVIGPVDAKTGRVDKANCFLAFDGDPGNWVTAQCVSESALALVLNRDELPPRSQDGFGTPAELLGGVLLKRLKETKVRPIVVQTSVRLKTVRHEWAMYPLVPVGAPRN